MTRHVLIATSVVIGGVMALGCHTPSSEYVPLSGGMPASATNGCLPHHGSRPRPRLVAARGGQDVHAHADTQDGEEGWYGAAGAVLRELGRRVVLRALSTCSPQSLIRAARFESREQLAKTSTPRVQRDRRAGRTILQGRSTSRRRQETCSKCASRRSPAIDYACNSFSNRSSFLRKTFQWRRHEDHRLDTVRMLGKFSNDVIIPLHPFFGSVGVAPPKSFGRVNGAPPGIHAGIWTTRPIARHGIVHKSRGAERRAAQRRRRPRGPRQQRGRHHRDGDVAHDLQLVLHKNMHLNWPRAETLTHYIAMGTIQCS